MEENGVFLVPVNFFWFASRRTPQPELQKDLVLHLPRSLEEVQETFNNYMSVGSAGCPQQSFEELCI